MGHHLPSVKYLRHVDPVLEQSCVLLYTNQLQVSEFMQACIGEGEGEGQ